MAYGCGEKGAQNQAFSLVFWKLNDNFLP